MRNTGEPPPEDTIRHGWHSHQGQAESLQDLLANHSRPGNPRSLLDDPNLAILLLHAMVFGEDESNRGLIREAINRHMISDALGEWPWPIPVPNRIQALINIGNSMETDAPVGIFPEEVHFFCTGASGSGKTTLALHIIRQLLDLQIPVLIFDAENEFAQLLNDDRINVLGLDDFLWNPLAVPPGMDPVLYRQIFCAVFADQLGLLIASKTFLLSAIDRLYTAYDTYNGSGIFPSVYDLADLLQGILNRHRTTTRNYTYGEVCLNRVEGFTLALPRVLNCSSGLPMHILTRGSVILELAGLDFEYQALLITLILTWICCHRVANGLRNRPEHRIAVILDECQRLFDAQLERRMYQGIPTIAQITAVVRKYNLMLFSFTQQSSKVCTSLKANSFCKVLLPVRDGGDLLDMGTSMFLTPEQTYFCRNLERGQAVIKLSGRYTEPFPITIPYNG